MMPSYQTINAGGMPITVHKDLRVPMRDGVELAADAYQGPGTNRARRWSR